VNLDIVTRLINVDAIELGQEVVSGETTYRSKLQPTVSTISTKAEFIAAVAAAKTAKYIYVRSSPNSVLRNTVEDNEATILVVNATKPMARSTHIAMQHFAIQEWKAHSDIILEHIPGTINPADALTKALGWILHSRHVRRAMEHHALCLHPD
jgi:hypothetical protein